MPASPVAQFGSLGLMRRFFAAFTSLVGTAGLLLYFDASFWKRLPLGFEAGGLVALAIWFSILCSVASAVLTIVGICRYGVSLGRVALGIWSVGLIFCFYSIMFR